jgi:hypothetical protein
MRYRFIGQYTLGRTSICMNGVTFEGQEPSEVPADIEHRFSGNVEFEIVANDNPDEQPVVKKRQGRPRKVIGDG